MSQGPIIQPRLLGHAATAPGLRSCIDHALTAGLHTARALLNALARLAVNDSHLLSGVTMLGMGTCRCLQCPHCNAPIYCFEHCSEAEQGCPISANDCGGRTSAAWPASKGWPWARQWCPKRTKR